jgi:hypothetical protein
MNIYTTSIADPYCHRCGKPSGGSYLNGLPTCAWCLAELRRFDQQDTPISAHSLDNTDPASTFQQDTPAPTSEPFTTSHPNIEYGHADPTPEKTFPCRRCGKERTKSEGGGTFTLCDECWVAEVTDLRITLAQKDAEIARLEERDQRYEALYRAAAWVNAAPRRTRAHLTAALAASRPDFEEE